MRENTAKNVIKRRINLGPIILKVPNQTDLTLRIEPLASASYESHLNALENFHALLQQTNIVTHFQLIVICIPTKKLDGRSDFWQHEIYYVILSYKLQDLGYKRLNKELHSIHSFFFVSLYMISHLNVKSFHR